MDEMNDNELRILVEQRLRSDPTIDATGIDVVVESGFVNLNGHVETKDDRAWAEALIRQIPEVKDVFNYLSLERKGIVGDTNFNHNMI